MNPASNIILIGPMGAGKTSIGRRLAGLMGLHFVDADHRLEEITGVAVPLIFECEGEAGFRQRESLLIAELCQGKNQLIATGQQGPTTITREPVELLLNGHLQVNHETVFLKLPAIFRR